MDVPANNYIDTSSMEKWMSQEKKRLDKGKIFAFGFSLWTLVHQKAKDLCQTKESYLQVVKCRQSENNDVSVVLAKFYHEIPQED